MPNSSSHASLFFFATTGMPHLPIASFASLVFPHLTLFASCCFVLKLLFPCFYFVLVVPALTIRARAIAPGSKVETDCPFSRGRSLDISSPHRLVTRCDPKTCPPRPPTNAHFGCNKKEGLQKGYFAIRFAAIREVPFPPI